MRGLGLANQVNHVDSGMLIILDGHASAVCGLWFEVLRWLGFYNAPLIVSNTWDGRIPLPYTPKIPNTQPRTR